MKMSDRQQFCDDFFLSDLNCVCVRNGVRSARKRTHNGPRSWKARAIHEWENENADASYECMR